MEGYFRTTSYALVTTAFVAIALTGTLDGVSIALYSLSVGICFYRDSRGVKRLRMREWMWRVLSIAYVPFVFIDAAFISNRVLALVHMTLFVSAAKLFQNKRDRDWVFLYLIAFFQMLLAAGLTFNAIFVASLALFLFFFISTLAAFEIRRARREVSTLEEETIAPIKQPQRIKYRMDDPRVHAKKKNRVRYLFGASFAQIVIVAALTLPFFFLIPRFGGGGVAQGFGEGDAVTGFSDRVELGQVASIKRNPRVVMRVRLDHRPTRYLRWRGVALESYDGHGWSVASERSERRDALGQEMISARGPVVDARFIRDHVIDPKRVDHNVEANLRAMGSAIEQTVVLEPLSTDTLFAAQRAYRLRGPLGTIFKDRLTGALSAQGIRSRITYQVSSDISVPSEQELRLDSPASAPQDKKDVCLQGVHRLDPRISQLTHEIVRNAPTPYDKARAIEHYLKTEFHYTLDLKSTDADPLAEFLFKTREGHCEYFATAMVMMLRTLEIPARIVNGFQMGEYNELNDMYTVRESDAHSWVEAYFPRTDSWIEFDPTPSAGINDYSLDSDEQASIMVDVQHRLLTVKDRLLGYYLGARLWVRSLLNRIIVERSWTPIELFELTAAFVLMISSVMGLYIILAHRKQRSRAPTGYGPWWHRLFILPTWRRRLRRRDYRQSAVLFYEQMLAIARRAGLVKQPYETPVEFAVASGLAPIKELTTLYNRVRFGGGSLDTGETRKVIELLAELKGNVRGRKLRP